MKKIFNRVIYSAVVLMLIIPISGCFNFNKKSSLIKNETFNVDYLLPGRIMMSYYYEWYEFNKITGLIAGDEIVVAGNPEDPTQGGSTRNKFAGYTFVAWSLDGKTPLEYGQKIVVTEYTRIYAMYSANIYSVNYELNGGTFVGIPVTSYTIEDGVRGKIELCSATKNGYRFVGWHLRLEDEILNSAISEYIFNDKNNLGNKTYVAEWEIIEYNIQYYFNNHEPNELEDLVRSYTIEDEVQIIDVTANPNVGGNATFLGWYDNEQLEGEPITSIPKGSTGNKIYWAKWE